MTQSYPAVTLSIRISPDIQNQLSELSEATGRTKSFLAAEAIENYLTTQAWQVSAIKQAVKKANTKGAKFIDHKKVTDWISSWGSTNDQDMPK